MLTATTSNSRADVEVQHAERADQAVEHLRAEHRALVIHEREHHRPLAEVLAEPHLAAGFVGERQIERHLLIQMLIDADFFSSPGFAFAGSPASSGAQPLRARGRRARRAAPLRASRCACRETLTVVRSSCSA